MSKQPAHNLPYSNDEGATVLAQEAGANEGRLVRPWGKIWRFENCPYLLCSSIPQRVNICDDDDDDYSFQRFRVRILSFVQCQAHWIEALHAASLSFIKVASSFKIPPSCDLQAMDLHLTHQ
jgi:hypothetical protein